MTHIPNTMSPSANDFAASVVADAQRFFRPDRDWLDSLYINLYRNKFGITTDSDTTLDEAAENAAREPYGRYLGTILMDGVKTHLLDLTHYGREIVQEMECESQLERDHERSLAIGVGRIVL